mgnify:CR=1 FL=1
MSFCLSLEMGLPCGIALEHTQQKGISKMASKTIIDGIDVSKCSNNSEQYFECESSCCHCDEIPNCYFKQLARAKEENIELKAENFAFDGLVKTQEEMLDDYNTIIERFLIASGKSKDITQPDEFEEVFEDIEQTYSEYEELINENRELRNEFQAKEQECEELKETIDVFITDNNSLYSDDGKQPSNLDELQECMQSSMNEFLKYKQALDEIEKYCNDILADRYHYSTGAVLMATKLTKDIINKAKDGE